MRINSRKTRRKGYKPFCLFKNNEKSAQNLFCIDPNSSHNNILNEISEKHTSHVSETSTLIPSFLFFQPVSQLPQISQILQLLVNINNASASVSANPEQTQETQQNINQEVSSSNLGLPWENLGIFISVLILIALGVASPEKQRPVCIFYGVVNRMNRNNRDNETNQGYICGRQEFRDAVEKHKRAQKVCF